jgi:hypothetical protein
MKDFDYRELRHEGAIRFDKVNTTREGINIKHKVTCNVK